MSTVVDTGLKHSRYGTCTANNRTTLPEDMSCVQSLAVFELVVAVVAWPGIAETRSSQCQSQKNSDGTTFQ